MKKHVRYWIDSADHDLAVAESLFKSEKYDWCLFIAHLVLEKVLKGCYVERKGDLGADTLISPKKMS